MTMTPERPTLEADIACVGFGPAMGGFLTTLSRASLPPLQIICYERADDVAFGVSGVVTRARGIRTTFPSLDPADIPMAVPVKHEKVVYLLDPIGASRRSLPLRLLDTAARFLAKHHAIELPYIPPFLHKGDGLILSIGQFNQWVASELMATGAVQIWPGSPVAQPLIEDNRVAGVRLVDQGPEMPGMDLRAPLTVVADGPVGAAGRYLDKHYGMPAGHHQQEWAVGMKMVMDLREDCPLEPGTVVHTFGFPEPEIFGFLYVHPGRVASVGIFIPSWFRNPARTSYRYLQHFIQHPYLWRSLRGAKLRSWGAKSLQESGRRGEPWLAGDGYARIGEGSGSTNVLTGSGVDEAWTTGILLAEGVIELIEEGRPYTKENLDRAYVARRRASWVEREGRVAEKARDGFHHGVLTGLFGMALTGFTNGRLSVPGKPRPLPAPERFCPDFSALQREAFAKGIGVHDALMDRRGWPPIPYDGQLLVSHQDALLMGGKVQAPPGYADHVVFRDPGVCERCAAKLCIEICSAQAIAPGETAVPAFDREKCVHCGACLWNCAEGNLEFTAAPGGLHSAEN